ncbi:MAG: hypothetical protein ABJG41_02340 [Cyclobacteriaceae bacterium]
MKIKRSIGILILLISTTSCDLFDDHNDEECQFDMRLTCSGTSWAFVDPDTWENLLGYDKPINPDSLVLINERGYTMPIPFSNSTHLTPQDWMLVNFSPFDEIYCFNQCKLDSVVVLNYYLYLGNGDTDTISAYFAPHSEKYYLLHNGKKADVPTKAIGIYPNSQHWFFKEGK